MFTFVFFRKMAVKYSDEPKYDWVSLSKKKKGDRAISAFFPLQLTLLSRNTDHHQQSHVFVEWLFLFSLKALILRSWYSASMNWNHADQFSQPVIMNTFSGCSSGEQVVQSSIPVAAYSLLGKLLNPKLLLKFGTVHTPPSECVNVLHSCLL